MLKKTVKIGVLFDYYGHLLTERQGKIVADYYLNNFSLGEISARFGISRQAVYDHLQRAEKSLVEFEAKLHLAEKDKAIKAGLEDLRTLVKNLPSAGDADKVRLIKAITALEENYEGV